MWINREGMAETLLDFSNPKAYPAIGLVPLCHPRTTVCMDVALIANQIIGRGTVMSESSTRGTFVVYDGSLPARGLSRYPCWSDANGVVTVDGPYMGWPQLRFLTVPVFLTGQFRTNQLVGLTAAAVQDLGRILSGTINDGILNMR